MLLGEGGEGWEELTVRVEFDWLGRSRMALLSLH